MDRYLYFALLCTTWKGDMSLNRETNVLKAVMSPTPEGDEISLIFVTVL